MMTKAEAVKWLESLKQEIGKTKNCSLWHYAEAIGMVIEVMSEPKTGEWVWSDEDASWMCGACCCVFEEIDWKPNYNFCPNCGAKMGGGAE